MLVYLWALTVFWRPSFMVLYCYICVYSLITIIQQKSTQGQNLEKCEKKDTWIYDDLFQLSSECQIRKCEVFRQLKIKTKYQHIVKYPNEFATR